jgi:hypothetical protein
MRVRVAGYAINREEDYTLRANHDQPPPRRAASSEVVVSEQEPRRAAAFFTRQKIY